MSLLAYLVIALAIFGAGGALGIKWEIGIVAERDLAVQKEAVAQNAKRVTHIDEAAAGQEADKRALRKKFTPIDQEVNRVTQTDFYGAAAPACFNDDGLRQLRAALATPAPAASQPAGVVPRPGGTHWWESAGDPPLVR